MDYFTIINLRIAIFLLPFFYHYFQRINISYCISTVVFFRILFFSRFSINYLFFVYFIDIVFITFLFLPNSPNFSYFRELFQHFSVLYIFTLHFSITFHFSTFCLFTTIYLSVPFFTFHFFTFSNFSLSLFASGLFFIFLNNFSAYTFL